MKTINFLFGLSMLSMVACKKEKDPTEDEPGSNKKLTEIVAQAYLDEAKKMGFTVHTGNNPPDIGGEYLLAPWRFDAHNDPSTYGEPGSVHQGGFRLQVLYEQSGGEIWVNFNGYFQGDSDLSKPFIIGSGNNFTICRHRYGTGGTGANFGFPFVFLVSGTKDGNELKNVKMATIRLKSESPYAVDEKVGQITIYSDADGVSQ